jgi:hypothetical protein
MSVKSQNEEGTRRVKAIAERVIREQPHHQLGSGFLWVVAHFAGSRSVKFLAASIDGRTNHDVIVQEIEALPGVQYAWINLD